MAFEMLKEAFAGEDKTVDIKFDRTITIPGYKPGGESENLQVVQCEAYIAYLHRTKGLLFPKKDIGVKPMICTAYISDKDTATRAMLRKACPDAPDDKVIVVNKMFMSFFTFPLNAFRVALLEGESAKANVADGWVHVIEQEDVARWCGAREGHTDFVVNHAFRKADEHLRKQCRKFATANRRERKKGGFEWVPNGVAGVN